MSEQGPAVSAGPWDKAWVLPFSGGALGLQVSIVGGPGMEGLLWDSGAGAFQTGKGQGNWGDSGGLCLCEHIQLFFKKEKKKCPIFQVDSFPS